LNLRLISRLALSIQGQPVKPCRATPPMASRCGLFGLELPCSRRIDRLLRRGHGVIYSLHDCQLQLGGPVGWAVRRGLPVRLPAGLSTSLAGPSYGVCSSPYVLPDSYLCPGHTFLARCFSWVAAWFGVLAIWRVRQLSRGCVDDGLACSDPMGTSWWSRLIVKERASLA
jgi:hypothetical protein